MTSGAIGAQNVARGLGGAIAGRRQGRTPRRAASGPRLGARHSALGASDPGPRRQCAAVVDAQPAGDSHAAPPIAFDPAAPLPLQWGGPRAGPEGAASARSDPGARAETESPAMPVLPLIDLMLLAGWTSLLVGFVLKAVGLVMAVQPTIAKLAPVHFLMIAVAAFLFAIALAARTWVASQAPAVSAARRRDETLEAYRALHRSDAGETESEEVAAAADGLTSPAQR